jgi:hypothetical protein
MEADAFIISLFTVTVPLQRHSEYLYLHAGKSVRQNNPAIKTGLSFQHSQYPTAKYRQRHAVHL